MQNMGHRSYLRSTVVHYVVGAKKEHEVDERARTSKNMQKLEVRRYFSVN